MNTLSIIILALNTALVAVRTVDGFITDPEISRILDGIGDAIEETLNALAPHQKAAVCAARHGQTVPATAPVGS